MILRWLTKRKMLALVSLGSLLRLELIARMHCSLLATLGSRFSGIRFLGKLLELIFEAARGRLRSIIEHRIRLERKPIDFLALRFPTLTEIPKNERALFRFLTGLLPLYRR